MRRTSKPNPVAEVITLICFAGIVLIGAILAIAVFDPGPAHGSTRAWHQPYGGCKEAGIAPHSVGARECLAHGFAVVRREPIRAYWMNRPCATEDSVNCYWNDGSGHPLYSRKMPSGKVCRFYVQVTYARHHDHCFRDGVK
jgi:hypothetical protein